MSSAPPEPALCTRTPRRRAADRAGQIVEVADRQINARRAADVSMHVIGEQAGVSRALVYAYFPDQFRLVDAVLARHVAALRSAGIDRAAGHGAAEERVRAVAVLYMRHAAEHGAALEYVLRDAAVMRELDGTAIAFRARLLRHLGRALRRELTLTAHESLVFVQLLEVIPCEAARLVREEQLPLDEAVALTERLVRASVSALRPYRR